MIKNRQQILERIEKLIHQIYKINELLIISNNGIALYLTIQTSLDNTRQ